MKINFFKKKKKKKKKKYLYTLNLKSAKKPFNPVLGEYFRSRWKFQDNTYGYYIGEQTSLKPPISSYYFCNPANGIVIHGETSPKTKLSGTNLKTVLKGGNKIIFFKHHKYYNSENNKGIFYSTIKKE